jgi:ribonucleotide reductase alpha subunit
VIETPEEMFWRVGRNVAQADRRYHPQIDLTSIEEEFYAVMASFHHAFGKRNFIRIVKSKIPKATI